jgi:catechol 2,3-dioxygenase-like lactoylglutathione lyase family enzyme
MAHRTVTPDVEVLPVLPSLDLAETRDFYSDHLGFEATVYKDEGYLILRRGPMELHFWKAADRALCEQTSVYIRGDIGPLHTEFSARGVPGITDLQVRPWGMREFYIHDPHGNLLRFGQAWPPEPTG